VHNCTEAELRAAIAGGGTVTFACDGIITLASTITNTVDTALDATGHQVTISGDDKVRVFYVGSNTTFVVNHLTIALGRSTNGSGILNDHGTVNATNVSFCTNIAAGASGESYPKTPGESASGGAVVNHGAMNLVNCSFIGNSATGGTGGFGSSGSAGFPGGHGSGGAIRNEGTLMALGCTLAANSALGGSGGNGGAHYEGGQGGAGGAGGDGSGGALLNEGTAQLVTCTLASNTGAGGLGGAGGGSFPPPGYPPKPPGPDGVPGSSLGSAVYDVSGQCWVTNCTVAYNSGTAIKTTGAAMVNTILSENLPGGNCSGVITDLGHNLSSDLTCNFTNVGSLNNTYPLLGPLTNNGGPTLTVALLPASRAIDAGDTAAAPPTDQRGVARPFGAAADIGAYEYNSPGGGGPSTVITEATEPSLRAAMSGGGAVTFACDGTITLSSTIMVTTSTVLDAANHQVTITAGENIPAFSVGPVGPGVSFALSSLAISNCAGIQNAAGSSLKATNCVFWGNYVPNSGAAIRNSGDVQLTSCVFQSNRVSVSGGALDNSGTATADLCTFIGNSAVGLAGASGGWYGTPGGPGADGKGGAIRNTGTLGIFRSTFTNNAALGGLGANGWEGHHVDFGGNGQGGGTGGSGGNGEGGAIYNAGTARLVNTTLAYNTGTGGSGGKGGNGGASYSIGAPGSGGGGGGGGQGGNGVGAVFNSGVVQVINSTFAFNSGSGGTGGAGAAGGSGTLGGNGGRGGNGGSGFGAVYDQSSCAMTNVTLALNSGTSGTGGAGGAGGTGTTANGSPGVAGSPGSSGGGITTTGAQLVNTLLTENAPGNYSGSITDLGHNLSSTAALVLPLANNGGPTLTMALLPGTPAIDAGDSAAAPPTDQRGFPRPAGAAPDIGAYESGSMMPTATSFRADATGFTIGATGNAGQSCRLLTSADLLHWSGVATNRFGSDGKVLFRDTSGSGACRFYRLAMP
jgi:hypothetical protein